MKKKNILWTIFAIAGIAAIVQSCHTVAVTGRKQLLLVNPQELNASSFQQYDQFLDQNKVSTNVSQTQMVKRCGKRIQQAVERYMIQKGLSAQLEGYNWEFNLVDDPTVNAWCMPGGKVVFYTGIMPVCQNEEGLAVVMGHEIAHAIANHGGERMSNQMAVQGLLGAGSLSLAMKEKPSVMGNILLQAAGAGSQIGMLAFSRKHESEADKMGLIFMAMAGYNPRVAPGFWERMSAGGGQAPPEFMSTHPSHDTRVNNLNKWMPEALEYYKK
ncbi:MAG: M48 family metallopeptidase [Cyclobacteriaceae bacterium]